MVGIKWISASKLIENRRNDRGEVKAERKMLEGK